MLSSSRARVLANLIHRELIQLAMLAAIAVVAFFVTRAAAAYNRERTQGDAAAWHRRGQDELTSGHVDAALEAFRRAAVKNRGEKTYALALARALAAQGQHEAARRATLALRESAPEDPQINLELARLAAGRHDVTESLRYYRNALYAPWPAEAGEAPRRQIRLELIRFLLANNENNQALAELLALSADLPEDVDAYVETAGFFAKAGDTRRALDQFARALRLDPRNGRALAGAGEAAFERGDYPLARAYFRRAPADLDDVRDRRTLVELVLSSDPLASRLGSAERARRLIANMRYAEQRLTSCVQRATGGADGDLDALRAEAKVFAPRLKPPAIRESDTIDAGVDLIDRIEAAVVERCPPADPRDEALMLIGRRHGMDSR